MRLTDADDLKYLYAAWRMGKLAFDDLVIEDDSPEGFSAGFANYISERYQVSYTLIATPPGRSRMPVGIVFGIVPLLGKRVIWLGDFTWFPWASSRNKLECAVHYLNQIRREWVILGFVNMNELSFFEHICRYGVLRRVGTVFDMLGSGPLALFQTRKPFSGGN